MTENDWKARRRAAYRAWLSNWDTPEGCKAAQAVYEAAFGADPPELEYSSKQIAEHLERYKHHRELGGAAFDTITHRILQQAERLTLADEADHRSSSQGANSHNQAEKR